MTKQKPFLKWAGGKYRCLEQVLASLPQGKRLVEPFMGSGVIFMNTHYDSYLLADTNPDLISLYQLLQKKGSTMIRACEAFFSPENNQSEKYYAHRASFNETTDRHLRACLFLYLNRHGYNGLCRYNQKGYYNVPFGRYHKPYFPKNELEQFLNKSQIAVNFVCADFRETFAQAEQGDVIYCDPPYAPICQTSNFSSYSHQKFGEKEQIELTRLAIKTASRGIPVIISNHDTPFTRAQYASSQIHSFAVRRTISRNPQERKMIRELIAVFDPHQV
jgi:DNA adenine methylase